MGYAVNNIDTVSSISLDLDTRINQGAKYTREKTNSPK